MIIYNLIVNIYIFVKKDFFIYLIIYLFVRTIFFFDQILFFSFISLSKFYYEIFVVADTSN